MVTVSLGSEVSGISKASGGKLSRRLTLTVVDAMLARDWGGNRKDSGVELQRRWGHTPQTTFLLLPAQSFLCASLGLGALERVVVASLAIWESVSICKHAWAFSWL